MKQKTALVLGATGTIGHALCRRLKQEGYWIRAVDRKMPEYSKSAADELVLSDLRKEDAVRFAFTHGMDEPFDEAFAFMAEMGGASFVFTRSNDSEIIYNSAMMNLNVAKVATDSKVGKILFSSSACCYGEDSQMNIFNGGLKESQSWNDGKPDSVYGIEKLFSEQVYDSFRRNNNLNIRVCRFHNVFSEEGVWKGGREKFPAAICRKISEAKDGGEVEIFGDGLQTRSYLHVSEALDGVRKLMDSKYQFPVNIGSEVLISCNDLAKMVIGISGKSLTIKNVESKALGVRGRCSDNTLVKAVLNWYPVKPLREGMEKLYSFINKQVNS